MFGGLYSPKLSISLNTKTSRQHLLVCQLIDFHFVILRLFCSIFVITSRIIKKHEFLTLYYGIDFWSILCKILLLWNSFIVINRRFTICQPTDNISVRRLTVSVGWQLVNIRILTLSVCWKAVNLRLMAINHSLIVIHSI